MSTQPEALRLAEIGQYLEGGEKANWNIDVCAELRRLHAANVDCLEHFNALKAERDELLAALDKLAKAAEWGQVKPVHNLSLLGRALAKSKKAITKAAS